MPPEHPAHREAAGDQTANNTDGSPGPLPGRLVRVTQEVLDRCASANLSVRAIGGIAIWLRASDLARELFPREYADIDFVAYAGHATKFASLLKESGYLGDKEFNALNGERRLVFYPPDHQFHIDVFLDRFQMSHSIDLRKRLLVEDLTVPGAELLLSKLQVAEVNRKDLTDIIVLLADHELADTDGPRRINVARIANLCSVDWGLFTTACDNIAKAKTVAVEMSTDRPQIARLISERLESVESRMVASPKSLGWKLRARVGRRIQWFEVPEDTAQ